MASTILENQIEFYAYALCPLALFWWRVGRVLITGSFSLLVIDLFKLLIWFWFNFVKWCLWTKFSIYFTFPNLVKYRFLKSILMIYWISFVSLTSPFSFLTLLMCIFSFHPLVNFDKHLSILSIYLKNQIFFHLFFVSILLISVLNLIIYCCIVIFFGLVSFCSRVFKYSVKFLVYLFRLFI